MRNPLSSPAKSPSKLMAEDKAAVSGCGKIKTSSCCNKDGVKRGPWTAEEDELLSSYIKREGEGRWRMLPKKAGLLRCGKSCRLRWMNYLRPSVKRGHISPDEEDLILRLHRLLGNRWSLIAGRLPGRTDNEIKNYWNTHLSKKLISQGIDPRTHKPLSSSSSSFLNPNYLPSSSSLKLGVSTIPNANQDSSNPNSITVTALAPPALRSSTEKGNDLADQMASNEEYYHHEEDLYDIQNHLQGDIFSSFLDSLMKYDEGTDYVGETNLVQTKCYDYDDQEAKVVNDLDVHLFVSNYSQATFNVGGDGWDAPFFSASGSAYVNDINNFNENVDK